MLWNQNIREPISLADGRRVATLADVRSLLCEMSDGLTPGEKRVPLMLQLLEKAKSNPSRETLRSLQELLWLTLSARALI
jgi:hypothetical protein